MWNVVTAFVFTTILIVPGQGNKQCLRPSTGLFGICLPTRLCSDILVHNNLGQNGCERNEVCCPTPEKAGTMLNRSDSFRSEILMEEFPHMVLIGYDSGYGRSWKCSGALIDETTVITSASCLNLPNLNNPVVVKTFEEEIPIIETKPNPLYNPRSGKFDTANLYLARPAKLTSHVKKACISPGTQIPSQVIISGWGSLSFDNMLHLTVNQNINFTHVRKQNDDGDSFTTIQEGRFSCYADEGGLAHTYDETKICSYVIVGVLSSWKDCGEDISIGHFTKISRTDAWIR